MSGCACLTAWGATENDNHPPPRSCRAGTYGSQATPRLPRAGRTGGNRERPGAAGPLNRSSPKPPQGLDHKPTHRAPVHPVQRVRDLHRQSGTPGIPGVVRVAKNIHWLGQACLKNPDHLAVTSSLIHHQGDSRIKGTSLTANDRPRISPGSPPARPRPVTWQQHRIATQINQVLNHDNIINKS